MNRVGVLKLGIGLMSGLGFLVIFHFGWTKLTVVSLIFTCVVIVLSLIDAKTYCLPDVLTLPLLWFGLLMNIFGCFASLEHAVLGAVIGYLLMAFFAKVFYLCTKKVGLGQGDWKLFAALGAWFGWQSLPIILAIASLSGLIFFMLMMMGKKIKSQEPLPFGPFLSLSGWLMLWSF